MYPIVYPFLYPTYTKINKLLQEKLDVRRYIFALILSCRSLLLIAPAGMWGLKNERFMWCVCPILYPTFFLWDFFFIDFFVRF